MQFTIKLENDRYLDLLLIPSKRILVIMSPIPNLTEDELTELVAAFNYTIILPLTGVEYKPDLKTPDVKETYLKSLNKFYTMNTGDALACVLSAANLMISGFKDNEI